MNIAIVDDMKADREKVNSYLKSYLKNKMKNAEINCYENGSRFFDNAVLADIDVAFLDIFVGDLTGIDIAARIREENSSCLIVLSSVSKEFIHASYDLNALYYLIKPYDYETFVKVMERVDKRIDSRPNYIEVMANRKNMKVRLDDILYVDKNRNSVQLHLKDGVLKVWAQTFAEMQEALLTYPQFVKCFHCILLNMKHAVQICNRDFVLTSGERIPISRDSVSEIHDKYTRFIFNSAFGG